MITSPQFRGAGSTVHQNFAPKGLKNLGNSCYMNAIMQSLAYCDCLYRAVRSSTHSSACELSADCILCALERCVTDLRRPVPLNRNFHPMSRLVRLLPEISQNGAIMAAGRQEDAHEYLSNLIHAAVEAGARTHVKEIQRVDEQETSGLCGHREQYLHALFKGGICSQIRCRQCGSVSSTAEAVQGLELEVAHAGTLQGALEGYCRTEELGIDTDNAYDCSVCKAHTSAHKSLSIVTAPQILRIQLKRFMYCEEGGGGSQKLAHLVEFPLRLDLAPYLRSSVSPDVEPSQNPTTHEQQHTEYRLSAAVVHIGQGLDSGHYAAFVRSSSGHGAAAAPAWFLANDDVVRRASLEEVLSQPVYMLFYERVGPCLDTNMVAELEPRQFTSPKRVEKRVLSVQAPLTHSGSGSLGSRLSRGLPVGGEVNGNESRHGVGAGAGSTLYQQQQVRSSKDGRFGSNPLFAPAASVARPLSSSYCVGSEVANESAEYHSAVKQRAARTFSVRSSSSVSSSASAAHDSSVSQVAGVAAAVNSGQKARSSYRGFLPQLGGLSRKRLFHSINLFSSSSSKKQRRDMAGLGHHLSAPPSSAAPGPCSSALENRSGVFFEQQQLFKDSGFTADDNRDNGDTCGGSDQHSQSNEQSHTDDRPSSAVEDGHKQLRVPAVGDQPSKLTGSGVLAADAAGRTPPRPANNHVSVEELRQGKRRKAGASWLEAIKSLFR